MSLSSALLGPSLVSQKLPKKESTSTKVKVKKRPPPKPVPPDSPVLNAIDGSLRSTFGSGRPLDDAPSIIQCKHCKKPMLQAVAYPHVKVCLQKKNEKAQKKKEQKEANRKAREAREKAEKAEEEAAAAEEDEDSAAGDKGGSTTGKNGGAGAGNASKKRKADGEDEKGPVKKKTKKEIEAAKPKGAKPKGPVDVEKQCGVLLPNGQMCARSLTCKSHAMGAKRAVPGRSQRYDLLLAAYQKKNQAKQQKAAIDANAPLLDDVAENAGPVDSDEEKELVMAAIARSRPRPLAQHVAVPMRRKAQYLRVKEMLSNALGTNRSANSVIGGGAGGLPGSAVSASGGGDGEGRRMSFAQPPSSRAANASGAGPSRKPSASAVPAASSTAIAA